MKTLAILLTAIPLSAIGQTCLERPPDLRTDKILVYLNSFSESTSLINEEFEKTNDPDSVKLRIKVVSAYSRNPYGNRIAPEDKYAIAVEEKIVKWLNENITSVCSEVNKDRFVMVNETSLANYKPADFRYVLKYRYTMPGGDPLETQMIFYFHDRLNGGDLINNDSTKPFRPFLYFTAASWYPFYGMIKASGKKKMMAEWAKCLGDL